MEAQILQILTEVQQGTKTPITAQKELLDLFGIMHRFIITYKDDGFDKELFWKTHDVLCELVSINEV